MSAKAKSIVNSQVENQVSDITPEIQQIALKHLSRRIVIPVEYLQIEHVYTPNFRNLKQAGLGFVVIDKRDGKIYDVVLNKNNPNEELNVNKLREENNKAFISNYGKLEPQLFNSLASISEQGLVRVVIEVYTGQQSPGPKLPDAIPERNITLQELESYHNKVAQQRNRENQATVNPIAQRIRQLGFEAIANPSFPFIYATLPQRVIKQLESWEEVLKISLDEVNKAELEIAPLAIGSNIVYNRRILMSSNLG
ncbi:hypothetical protein [Nostoc sp. WHI]|uniref:hypothetical protein n=1 Tax=Nostoc sp. WHI TaxID=2650611 RepID=UPI0018C6FF8A|nr:hypothetical protein [Nostoc sp. WHI]MBG1265864.1 hypothetical protein [Nostoc sp. WHI]